MSNIFFMSKPDQKSMPKLDPKKKNFWSTTLLARLENGPSSRTNLYCIFVIIYLSQYTGTLHLCRTEVFGPSRPLQLNGVNTDRERMCVCIVVVLG
jgi:hypothetical protein